MPKARNKKRAKPEPDVEVEPGLELTPKEVEEFVEDFDPKHEHKHEDEE